MASKKNLAILLIMPFAVSLLSFNVINATFNLIDNDILGIEWDYEDTEAFRLSENKYQLKATPINDRNYPVNQELMWNVYDLDGTETELAEIVKEGKNSFLHTKDVGEVYIAVSNSKGNVQRRMKAVIYQNNAIIFNTRMRSSQNNVDANQYYGEYDIVNGNKVKSSISYTIKALSEFEGATVSAKDWSQNLKVDSDKKVISIVEGGDAYVKFGFDQSTLLDTVTVNFKIVDEGVNVYNYDDLLYCTNKSSRGGEIVVLRKNLESLANTYSINESGVVGSKKNEETELFGHYSNGKYSFASEIYTFPTHFNKKYIEQWNQFVDEDARNNGGSSNYSHVSDLVKAGIHVTKDFYGNGFTINMHNLTYPYASISAVDQATGQTQLVPRLTDDNLFRGPLPYYTLGDPNNMPLVTAYGQDNIGMYVEGNDITINDLVLKNCDFGNNLANLDYVGTVMELYGNNITIKNSRLSNGKNVFKSYDSQNVLMDNCMLSYSRNFLCMTGSYNFYEVKSGQAYQFTLENGTKKTLNMDEYLSRGNQGDETLKNYLMGTGGSHMLEALRSIQGALDNQRSNTFKGSLKLNDTLFYRSGISSIAFETLFNGAFLYNKAPSMISDLFEQYQGALDGKVSVPFIPEKVGGISYPVELQLSGTTKFYDYKTSNILDINGLVGESLSNFIQGTDYEGKFSLNTIFPIKEILWDTGKSIGGIYKNDGTDYINIPIAYYGGGLNQSKLTLDESFQYNNDGHLLDTFNVDFVAKYSALPQVDGGNAMALMANIGLKAVNVVAGFTPFKFALSKGDGYLYDKAPEVQELIRNYK